MASSEARPEVRGPSTRREFLAAGLAAAGGSLLALVTPASVRIARAQSSAHSGGTVIVAYLARPRSLDPNVWTGYSDNMVMRQIYDPLIWSTKLGLYTPGLATSWTITPDGKTYTFMLRRDVKFHDGTPFDAEAVKFMFDRIADPATRSLQGPAIGPYDHAEVLNPSTVAIHLKEPFAPLLNNISGTALSPVSPAAAKRLGGNYAQNPVGTGPFVFEKWDGNDLYLTRNPAYSWGPTFMNHRGPAYLDRLVFKTIPEEATRMIALQRGEVTAVYFPTLDQVAQYRADKNYRVFQFTTPGHTQSIPMNIKLAPTDDPRVRQAILFAVDRKKVVDLVEFGNANVANGPFSQTTPFYDAAIESYYPYDRKRAGELLDSAGWKAGPGGPRRKGGQPLRIQFIMFDSGPLKRESEVVQAMLVDAGFDVALDVTGYDAFAKRVTDGTYNLSEIVYVGLDPNVPAFLMYHSSQITGGGQFNRTRIADPKLDALIEDGLKTTDLRRRKDAYTAVQEYVMKNALLLPTWENSLLTITKQEMQGMSFDLEGRWLFYNVWMQR
jgi:peptide/nickel transport system substrate-binding protein